jgi:hypothetical protein
MMKPIVFISSVSEGYEHIRQTARDAIAKTGGKPIGFEDFHALDKSSRNACLDGVRDCDIYVGILGVRYGWITPSGLSATEEEFNEAVHLGKRRLIFIEEADRPEEKQEGFVKRVGDYKSGRFWKKFKTPEDLKRILEAGLKEVFITLMKGLSESQIKDRLKEEILGPLSYSHDQTWLITAAMPDSQASFPDDGSFNDEKFAKQVFLVGQDGEPPVFEIELGKSKVLKEDHWLLEQTEKQHWREGLRLSIVRLYLDVCVVVGMNVTGREAESDYSSMQGLYVYPDRVQTIADAQLHFLSRLYDKFDPHLRWDRIALMSALHNVGHRNFAKPKPGLSSHPMSMRSDTGPFLAFDAPRVLERNQLNQPGYGRALRASFERILK